MARRELLLLAVCVLSASAINSTADNSGEIINYSTKLSAGANRTNEYYHMSKSLPRLLDFYNTDLLAEHWDNTKDNLTTACRDDVSRYISGLDNTELWALKMDDASGRYSTGWFWGNQYWTGSQTLCDNIAPADHTIGGNVKVEKVRNQRDAPVRKPFLNPPLKTYSDGAGRDTIPPFEVGFYVLRVNLNSATSNNDRILHVGLCLPSSCLESDVHKIVEETGSNLPTVSVKVEAVRFRHTSFNIFKDSTFIVLCLVTFGVCVLLAAGTFYDIYLQKQDVQRTMSSYGDVKVELSIPDKTFKNGKCGACNDNTEGPAETNIENSQNGLTLGQIVKELLLSFSLKINVKNICDQSVGSDTLPVIHGLKSISVLWVILGHTCIAAFKYSDNMEYRRVIQKQLFFQHVTSAGFSVDTFFFTSGLLVSFLYFRTNAKGKLEKLTIGFKGYTSGILHFLGLLAYRFARLTAPYLFVLGVVELVTKWLYHNSVFELSTDDHINCPNYWWRNILYINSLFPVDEMCMLWSWYISDDTQFYVVGAIILILATRHLKSAIALLAAILLSSWLTTGWIAFSNGHIPNSNNPLAHFDQIYDKQWTRIGPYLIGMCTGWVLFKTDCTLKMSKLAVAVGWLASASCLLSLVYGLYEADLSPYAGAAYSGLSHSVWALGLAWIVIACSTGYGGYINSILASPLLYPFSRVTYCTYLIHPIVINFVVMSLDHPLHLAKELVAVVFFGQTVISFILAFMISVAFEAPVVSMLRILSKLTPNQKKPQK